MGRLAAAVLLPTFLVGGAVMSASVAVVDVHEADGTHLVVPVPLAVARAALAFAPPEAKHLEAPEVAEYLPHGERLVHELEGLPDGTLLEVDDSDERVKVAKEGDVLRVTARDGDRSEVDLRLPLGSVAGILRAYQVETRSFRTSDLIAALQDAPGGPLVRVLDRGDRVEVRMW